MCHLFASSTNTEHGASCEPATLDALDAPDPLPYILLLPSIWYNSTPLLDCLQQLLDQLVAAQAGAVQRLDVLHMCAPDTHISHPCTTDCSGYCASYQLRKQALYNDMTRYTCCNGAFPCSGRCGEQKCPQFCLCVEVGGGSAFDSFGCCPVPPSPTLQEAEVPRVLPLRQSGWGAQTSISLAVVLRRLLPRCVELKFHQRCLRVEVDRAQPSIFFAAALPLLPHPPLP